MINKDRVVPVKATDLISLYGTMLNIAGKDVIALSATEPGRFDVSTYSATKTLIADEPVRSIKVSDSWDNDIYFVPDYQFEGFVGGEVDGDAIDPESADLYFAEIIGGVANITRITPAAN